MIEPNLVVVESPEALAQAAAERLAALAVEAVAARERFNVVLSGGETPRALYRLLARTPYQTQLPWPQFHCFWGDERCVPPDDLESNYHQAHVELLSHVAVPPAHVYRIRGELLPTRAAEDYADQLRRAARPGHDLAWPRFDLVLLGLGSDGHTASLFPGPLDERALVAPVVAVTADYAGRPADRVTLTPLALNTARSILWLVSGEAKAGALAATLQGPRDPHRLPAQRIIPVEGSVTWLIDRAAASHLKGKSR